jgi:hypothetical protein
MAVDSCGDGNRRAPDWYRAVVIRTFDPLARLLLLCMEIRSVRRDTGAMSEESLEGFIRRPFIAEPAHAQTAAS